MQAEAEIIREMSETLESAGFNKHQSDAFIQSTALAMKAFAVTPKILDQRLDKQRREWKQDLGELKDLMIEHKKGTDHRIAENKEDSDRRFDGIDRRIVENKQDSDRRFDGIDARLDRVDTRLDRVDGRLDRIDRSMNDLKNTMDAHGNKMTAWFLAFTLAILTGLIGAFSLLFTS